MFDFDTIVDRSGTDSAKWDRYKGRDVIPMWVADMDFRSPPAVIRALHERVEHGVFGYSHTPADLLEAVRERLLSSYGWDVAGEWIVWLPGLVCGLHVACQAVGTRGDDVLATTPVYPPFLTAPAHSHRHLVTAPLRSESNRWTFDLDAIEAAITPRTRLLLLCSPHNPVGRVWGRDELADLAEICLRHNVAICSDEIHADLVLDEDKPHIPTATLSPEVAAATITLRAPSKTFNIPGLGCSYAVIPDPQLRAAFKRAMAGIVPHVNVLGFTAALAAYRHGHDWHAALLAYLRSNRDLLEAAIGRMPGLSIAHVEATYLAWIDARQAGFEEPAKAFEAGGVGLSDGAAFGAPGFVRLNFGCPRPLLLEAIERMAKAMQGRPSS